MTFLVMKPTYKLIFYFFTFMYIFLKSLLFLKIFKVVYFQQINFNIKLKSYF